MIDSAPRTIEFHQKCSEPKELHEIPGANHIDLYDKDEFVDQAIERMITFFQQYPDGIAA